MSETGVMPKVLVLFDGVDEDAATLGELAAQGASSVRFTEVEVRVMGEPSARTRRRTIDSTDTVEEYHGIIIAGGNHAVSPAIETLLDALDRAGASAFVDTSFAIVGTDAAALRERVTRLGGIVVSEPRDVSDPHDRARQLGARLAKVVSWVRHGLSHEHGHTEHAKHEHGHHHAH
jgi:hypothetical protein